MSQPTPNSLDGLRELVNQKLIEAVSAGRYQQPDYLDVLAASEDAIMGAVEATCTERETKVLFQESKAHLGDLKKIKQGWYTLDEAIKSAELEVGECRKRLAQLAQLAQPPQEQP